MNKEQLTHTPADPWIWSKAIPTDVEDILDLVSAHYEFEVQDIFTANRTRMAYNLHKAILDQTFNGGSNLLTVARDKSTNKLIAWAWCERGKYTVYADEEMAVAEFAHVDLLLSSRQRIRLCAQILELWINWCEAVGVPVLSSTTIRDDQKAFMRIHDLYGFKRRGSFAYRKIND